jgi:SpoIID/LytB domain protein
MLVTGIFLWLSGLFGNNEPPKATPQKNDSTVHVKVLLKGKVPAVYLDVKGPFDIVDPRTGAHQIHYSTPKKGTLQIKNGLKWIEHFRGMHQIKIAPDESVPFLIDGIEYFGDVEVYSADNMLHVINDVNVEDYIKSYMIHHFSDKMITRTLLEAVSIVLRTDVYHTLMRNKNAFFHLDAKKVNYQGASLRGLYPVIDKAVDATRNKIMVYKGRPFPTTYTEHSAGQTASFKNIFRQNFDCPTGTYNPLALQNKEDSQWYKEIPVEEITERFGLSSIKKVDLFVDADSEKVYAVRFQDRVKHVDIPIVELKNMFPSNLFKIEVAGPVLKVTGWGKGLGCGLCLYNAERLEKEGANVEEILRSAFPQTSIEIKNNVPDLIAQTIDEDPPAWITKKISVL